MRESSPVNSFPRYPAHTTGYGQPYEVSESQRTLYSLYSEEPEPETEKDERTPAQRVSKSLFLAAVGILLAIVTFLPGEGVWLWFHDNLRGWFGWSILALPVIFLYTARQSAKEESQKSKTLLLVMIAGLVSVIIFLIGAETSEYISFGDRIASGYTAGQYFSGTGAVGALLGVPFLQLFGKAAGIIFCVVVLITLVLIFTEKNPLKLVGLVKEKPVKQQRQRVRPSPPVSEPARQGESEQYVDGYTNEQQRISKKLIEVLNSFGLQASVTGIQQGATFTRYEVKPEQGIKINSITVLAEDIAMRLGTAEVRVEAVPGKCAVGIEIPNKTRKTVSLQKLSADPEFRTADSDLTVCLGQDVAGNTILTDIAKMPHLLVAGTTGSGKSVCIDSLIVSILLRTSPSDVRFILVDPKMVDLIAYDGVPHLLAPVVTDSKKAAGVLQWAVNEMDRRYTLFSQSGVRDVAGYNRKNKERIPKIVVVIDEFADLMMTVPKAVEDAVSRLAQKARAAGIHLVIATQRPTSKVITGLIKANIPSRIALSVPTWRDFQTIINISGAETLLGNGDMLFSLTDSEKPLRLQGCYVSDQDRRQVIAAVKRKWRGEYDQSAIREIENIPSADTVESNQIYKAYPLLDRAARLVIGNKEASRSYIQQKLNVGYARAGRIIDQLEERGVIGANEGSKPRKVLMNLAQWDDLWQKAS